jgi:TRAP-type C4-dicarboxylate transport system permease small subunit
VIRSALIHGRRVSDRLLSWMVILAMAALTADVLWGVFSRYILGAQSLWTDELATTLMIWASMLGAALVYGERGHLGVDYFVGKLDPAAQNLVTIAVHVLVFAFAAGVMVYGGAVMVERTLDAGQVLPALGWKKGYTYLSVPICGAFLLFYALEGMLETLGLSAGEHVVARSPDRVIVSTEGLPPAGNEEAYGPAPVRGRETRAQDGSLDQRADDDRRLEQ